MDGYTGQTPDVCIDRWIIKGKAISYRDVVILDFFAKVI